MTFKVRCKGNQSDNVRFYVALTRARKSTWVLKKEPFGTPVRRAATLHRSVHAGNATAQAFFHKICDAILELSIPFEDIDLDYGSATLPHVAQCVEGAPLKSDSTGLARRSLVLKAAGAAWATTCPLKPRSQGGPTLAISWRLRAQGPTLAHTRPSPKLSKTT